MIAGIDLRSDSVTLPPPAMLAAMAAAPLGDDVYGEDPTVNRLEAMAAERLGLEAALLVPSGTMANLLAMMTHCPRGRKVLVGDRSDIWLWEAGGAAVLGGLLYEPVPTQPNGELQVADLERTLADPEDPQCAPAGLICLEDTHCLSGGRVLALAYLQRVREFADAHGLPLHLDGSRLFNAAIAQGVAAAAIARHCGSVSFCLSKGLAAPIGSLLAGSRDFIHAARRWRKMLGGGMRQAGVVAAAGIYALDFMVDRLAEDHEHARRLAAGLGELPWLRLDPEPPSTNIVFFASAAPRLSTRDLLGALSERGVRVLELGRDRLRCVTHWGIGTGEIDAALGVFRSLTVREAHAESREPAAPVPLQP